MDLPGATLPSPTHTHAGRTTNVLVGSARQLQQFALKHPDVLITEQIETTGRVTHTTAMRNPDVRATLWRVISREAAAAGLRFA